MKAGALKVKQLSRVIIKGNIIRVNDVVETMAIDCSFQMMMPLFPLAIILELGVIREISLDGPLK